ncbi:hypothetical protein ANSO36C_02600 [Nostoc cf. commune SO-36]|uniref:Uncharacterized protein n=1 Tax=Nostoc cf. commune SO-36 TaxID=449208 RepID=A0ABM7YV14_NOSCO|nr:hypothetical protein ANSO36C_02600 [Nostoc cf. commune SO-36]
MGNKIFSFKDLKLESENSLIILTSERFKSRIRDKHNIILLFVYRVDSSIDHKSEQKVRDIKFC